MNSLVQHEAGLIASSEALKELANRTDARILVLSDSHGEYELFKKIIIEHGPYVDAVAFCGDGCCDLAACLQEASEDEEIQDLLPPVIAMAKGNGDASIYDVCPVPENDSEKSVLRSIDIPERILFTAANRNILVVHGHMHSLDYGTETLSSSAYVMDADLVFYGHTHRATYEEENGTLILNPGSCARPRGGMLPSFAIVSFPGSIERFNIEFFSIEETVFGGYSFFPYSLM